MLEIPYTKLELQMACIGLEDKLTDYVKEKVEKYTNSLPKTTTKKTKKKSTSKKKKPKQATQPENETTEEATEPVYQCQTKTCQHEFAKPEERELTGGKVELICPKCFTSNIKKIKK